MNILVLVGCDGCARAFLAVLQLLCVVGGYFAASGSINVSSPTISLNLMVADIKYN
jgi:hypothetical protein